MGVMAEDATGEREAYTESGSAVSKLAEMPTKRQREAAKPPQQLIVDFGL